MVNRAVFFDKDGVLNRDKGLLDNLFDYEFVPNAPNMVAYACRKGFKAFIVTNQPVVARGLITEEALRKSLQDYVLRLTNQNIFAKVEKIYFCPHHPKADVASYRVLCGCRKPKPGLLHLAAQEFNLDLSKSFVVGDRVSDVIAGNLAGCTTIRFLTDTRMERMIETDLITAPEHLVPNHEIENMEDLRRYL